MSPCSDSKIAQRQLPYFGVLTGVLIGMLFNMYISEFNAKRTKKEKESLNTKIILTHLKYTYDILYKPKISVEFQDMLLDKDWFIRISECEFDVNEKSLLLEWFKRIKVLSEGRGFVAGVFTDVPITAIQSISGTTIEPGVVRFCFNKYYQGVSNILTRYEML